jgi:hypothetical protein
MKSKRCISDFFLSLPVQMQQKEQESQSAHFWFRILLIFLNFKALFHIISHSLPQHWFSVYLLMYSTTVSFCFLSLSMIYNELYVFMGNCSF